MIMPITALILVGSTVLVTLQGEPTKPVRASGPGYDGVIICAEERLDLDRPHGLTAADFWTPDAIDVQEAENLLPAYLNTPEAASVLRGTRIRTQLSRYKRQYHGEMRGGRREIWIFFCHDHTPEVREGPWLRGIVGVMGGGSSYFQITYQVDAKRFVGLLVNAPE